MPQQHFVLLSGLQPHLFDLYLVESWGQRLRELICLLSISDAEGVQVLRNIKMLEK